MTDDELARIEARCAAAQSQLLADILTEEVFASPQDAKQYLDDMAVLIAEIKRLRSEK